MENYKRCIISTNIEMNNGKYQWNKAIKGNYIDFIYDDIKGRLIVEDNLKDKKKLIVSYNNKQKEISYTKIIRLQITDLLFDRDKFKFNIGYTYQNTLSTSKIINRFIDHGKKYTIKCLTCGYKFERTETDVERGRGCPCCSGRIVIPGINDMWTTNPGLANLLADPEDGHRYTEFANQVVDWECPDCGEITRKMISVVNRIGLSCNSCGRGISYPNRFIFNLLRELNVNFKSEKIFDWSEGRIYDFYLEDYNCIIEAHGMQHYRNCGFTINVKEQQKIDKYKENIARNNKIDKYIIIDCRYSDAKYIMDNIKNSLLGQMFDLSNINIDELDKKSSTKMMFEINELYKNGIEVKEISQIYGLTVNSTYNYLHKAEKMNLIKFDYNKSKKIRGVNSHKTYYQNHSTPIKCIENGYCFGGLSLIESESEKIFGVKILRSCVCVALKNNKQTYGYTFKYITREEFNHQKDINPDMTLGDKFFDITINEKQIEENKKAS